LDWAKERRSAKICDLKNRFFSAGSNASANIFQDFLSSDLKRLVSEKFGNRAVVRTVRLKDRRPAHLSIKVHYSKQQRLATTLFVLYARTDDLNA
jgi:hypothetical protein